MILRWLLAILCGIPLALAALHTLIRAIRRIYRFPIPAPLTTLIDHPLRRKYWQPPDETAIRHGIQPGMTVLEVGPGTGTYTLAAGRRVGTAGKVIAIDIEPKIIAKLQARLDREGVTNVEAHLADVYDLPFPAAHFDLCYMITVSGEIPDLEKAVVDIGRVLKPGGVLVFSELLPDPDYPLPRTLVRAVTPHGFRLQEKLGNFLYYTLLFEKV